MTHHNFVFNPERIFRPAHFFVIGFFVRRPELFYILHMQMIEKAFELATLNQPLKRLLHITTMGN